MESPERTERKSAKKVPLNHQNETPEVARLIKIYNEMTKEKYEAKQMQPAYTNIKNEKSQAVGLAISCVQSIEGDTSALENIEGDNEYTNLRLDFDLDIVTDELYITYTELHNRERHMEHSWNPIGDEETDEDTVLYVDTLPISLKHYNNKPIAYTIPQFPSMLTLKKRPTKEERKLYNDIRHYYYYRDGPKLNIGFYELGYDYFFCQLLTIWIALHDGLYLQRAYDLPLTYFVPKMPFLLKTDEDLIHYFVNPIRDTRVLSFATETRANGLQQARISEQETESGEDRYYFERLDELVNSGITHALNTRIIVILRGYVDDKAQKYRFFVSDDSYETIAEAREALFRIRHLASLNDVLAVAPAEGAVSGSMAELLPITAGFATHKAIVPSYTYTEAETRWRQICQGSKQSKAEVDELRGIAKALDIKTKSKDAETLCRLISKQYELEYGERARMREVATEEIPLIKSRKSK